LANFHPNADAHVSRRDAGLGESPVIGIRITIMRFKKNLEHFPWIDQGFKLAET
jgi:hypothetical protein